MIDKITKHEFSGNGPYDFTILIPTWNNLPFLKLCLDSILKNSQTRLQIIVFINEGNDGTPNWLHDRGDIDFIHSEQNIGICYSMNVCRSMIKAPYILYLNDDMYVLPNWDTVLLNEIKKINSKSFMLSSTLIEPTDTGNVCVVVKDYGRSLEEFKESVLLDQYSDLTVNDWNGSTWPPNVVPVELWDMVGGLSIEFSPGMYSDPDFSLKLYQSGVRLFKGKGDSLVYHFGSKSTGRIKKNKGRDMFLQKWGMTAKFFTQNYLFIGRKFDDSIGKVYLSRQDRFINKLKRIISNL